ncbi:MAG: ABC transporter ATP-binding protein [Endomicrobium sp.]|nr:ABC transporter ATP-binding protein [Endomicrobium sp.]
MSKTILELKDIKKSFATVNVLDGINLKVSEGEFITLLGSSGCGKTTILRIIAGLEHPDGGQVILEGADVTALPAEKRNVNTIFQNYALFPHMNVEKNIGYALRLKGLPKREIKKAVENALNLVQLDGFQKRMPSQLSGGQSQRVAIARSVIAKPKVLLLDEPLGALDLQLRRNMQHELKSLQKRLGITFIYITHDQEEALNMSDRIAVMRNGLFEQLGSIKDIYDNPKTDYVAKFVGNSNIITGTVHSAVNDTVRIAYCGGYFSALNRYGVNYSSGQKITVAVRSENVNIIPYRETFSGALIIGDVKDKNFAGGLLRISAGLSGGDIVVSSRHGIDSDLKTGEKVTVFWEPENALIVEGSVL